MMDHNFPVIFLLSARVIVEPKGLEVGQLKQIPNFFKIRNAIFPEVKFLDKRQKYMQFRAFSEISEWLYLIDTERDNFKIRHAIDDGEIFELVAPQVEIFYIVQVVRFGLVEDQLES